MGLYLSSSHLAKQAFPFLCRLPTYIPAYLWNTSTRCGSNISRKGGPTISQAGKHEEQFSELCLGQQDRLIRRVPETTASLDRSKDVGYGCLSLAQPIAVLFEYWRDFMLMGAVLVPL